MIVIENCNSLSDLRQKLIDGEEVRTARQEPCEDAISRQAVLNKIKKVCFSREQEWVDFRVSQGSNGQRDLIINFIEDLPPVTPQPKTGHWIRWYEQKETEWCIENIPHCKCSECGKEYDPHSSQFIKYCNECGAKMQESEEV